MNSYAERKAIREKLERGESKSIDAGVKCQCQCGNIHYKRKANEQVEQPRAKSEIDQGERAG